MPYAEVRLWASAELFPARRVGEARPPRTTLRGTSDAVVRHPSRLPATQAGSHRPLSLGEGLCLELFEFGRGDRALVEQSLSCGDLFRSIAARPRNVFDVGLG